MAPFSYPRRVGFGECDPARIYYAPRAVDYAVEAIEAWCERELGDSWAEIVRRDALEPRVVRLECEYLRPLVAGQVVTVRVEAIEARDETFTLAATGELPSGEASFRARFDLGFAEPGRAAPLCIPRPYRERLTAEAGSGAPARVPRPWPGSAGAAPFARSRRVAYGDCGLGGSVHAPKLVEYAVEAAGEWYEACLGTSWIEQCARGLGTPFVNIACEVLRPIAPGQVIAMDVAILRLGRASIGYGVVGRDERGEPCVRADMSACHVTDEGGRARPKPFPDAWRERILAYRAACGGER